MGKFSTRFALAGAAGMLAASADAQINFNAVVSFPTENAGVYSFSTESC